MSVLNLVSENGETDLFLAMKMENHLLTILHDTLMNYLFCLMLKYYRNVYCYSF